MSKKRDVPPKPSCFGLTSIFRPHLKICCDCPYYYPCFAATETPFEITGDHKKYRRKIEEGMAKRGLPLPDAVNAVRYFMRYSVSENAVKLSFSRKLRKYGHT